jgi:mono/diheme cytochrome c family protein
LALPAGAAETNATGDLDLGRKVFSQVAQPSCTICHTLRNADASGKIGPDLDELKPDAPRVAKAVRNGTGVMPAYTQLTPEQIAAVAAYVASATGASK